MIGSFLTGISIGMLVTLLLSALFALITEQGLETTIVWFEVALIMIVCTVSTYLAVKLPAF